MTTALSIEDLTAEYEAAYRMKTPESSRMFAAAAEALPDGDTRQSVYYRPYPLYVAEASGSHLIDVDGNDVVDFGNCWTAMVLGHAPPAVVAAVTEQVRKGTAFAAANPHVQELAGLIKKRVPSVEKLRFCNSGSEACMMVIRAARAFTGRNKILKFDGAYHGSHDAFEVTLDRLTPGITAGVADDVIIAPYNDREATEQLITRYRNELACVIVEGVVGSAGMLPPRDGFLTFLREVTQRNNVLFAMDEVISLRLAEGGAQEYYGVRPDLTAMGKIIGGGFPVGAFGGRDDLLMQFSPLHEGHLHHSGTYNGNPVTMAAGVATLTELTGDRIRDINKKGERLRRRLLESITAAGIRAQLTGVGSLMAVHFTTEEVIRPRPGLNHPAILHLLHLGLFQRGIYANERASYNVTTAHSDAELDHLAEAVGDVLREIRPAIGSLRSDLLI